MTDLTANDLPPHADAEDRALFEKVSRDGYRDVDNVSSAETVGAPPYFSALECATAALWLKVRSSARNRSLISTLEIGLPPIITEAPHVVIMPGAFHRHHPHTGASGQRVKTMALEFGWPCTVVPVGSLGSLDHNADTLIDHLKNVRDSRIIVVSLSKGSADVATAINRANASDNFARVISWVSLSGMIVGTPLVGWLRRQWWRMPAVHALLWLKRLRFAEIAELARDDLGRLSAGLEMPPHVRALHVIGFPLKKHLRHPWARRAYRRLQSMGPNDGGGILLCDVERFPGKIYPVWGADHYLDPLWDFTPVLRNILLHAAASATAASAIPAKRSTR